ncbi:hypothetical protein MKQ68_25370 [Chitinophaga horti]|uniref:Uncharacterized protein n=1 Tax=Chitinophaga horti TaxID=2920382 RepID=A0ABY6J540_9BACT|nr:hypothetical protein [Chitinophaga horti]UYQ93416.1 hypothetical protein MKQ68_25370 [Chitinophaga horti]
MLAPAYNDKVFINCPFDDDYRPLLHAMIYSIYRCGFFPVAALSEDDGTDNRLDKIIRCIRGSRYGIHDLSRTEVNGNNLPRFNMPFEAGLFYAAKYFGSKSDKVKFGLVFEKTKYLYQQYISDLNGIDTKAHKNDPVVVLEKVRDWLKTSSKRITVPGNAKLKKDYNEFLTRLPIILEDLELELDSLLFNDYCQIVEEAVREKLSWSE